MSEAASSPADAGTPEAATAPVFSATGDRLPAIDPAKVARYDFRNPGFLSPGNLRLLEALHVRFVQHLSARLSTFFRMECTLKTAAFETATFANFCSTVGHPTHLSLFQVEPLRGVGLLEMSLPLALGMADRLLGGKGHVTDPARALTEIELALLEDVTQIVITDWANLWVGESSRLRPLGMGHETSGKFLQTSAPDTVFVVLKMDVAMGELRERIQLGLPFPMIETLARKLHSANPRGEDAPPKQAQWRSTFAGIAVPVTAEWNVRQISLQDVLTMRVGDLLELPRELIANTRVRLSNTEQFVGTVGVRHGSVAVQINHRLTED